MRRRDFLSVLGGLTAAAWPLAARAQKPGIPVIGFLSGVSSQGYPPYVAAFRSGLRGLGLIEGQNYSIEFRWAEGKYDRLPTLAAELVKRQVSVIVAVGSTSAALSAKAATASIPIVFITAADPVKLGLVASFNRPGGNVTGISFVTNELGAKRLEFLRELVPNAKTIGLMINPGNPISDSELKDIRAATQSIALGLQVVSAKSDNDLEPAFSTLAEKRVDAMIVAADPFFLLRAGRVIELAARYRLPASYVVRQFTDAGGLMSYGGSQSDAYRWAGTYVARILKGMKPSDLPVWQPTKFELVINLKTAQALGLTVPPTLLVAAEEVIE